MSWEKRILHLGLGRFHRGHQAVYYQRLSELTGEKWGVVSLSMRTPGARDELRSVNFSYPVLEMSAGEPQMVKVESIREALDLKEDSEKILEYFCDKRISLITLTITEKGYCLKSDGSFDLSHPQIQHDLSHPESPQTAIGLLYHGLKLRMETLTHGLTILSCDNLRENGHKLRAALMAFTHAQNHEKLQNWLDQYVSFPNTMVDRIVPSLTPEKTVELETTFHLPKQSQLIATETFSQWVIEDNFKGQRPPLEKVGVEFVRNVRPYEEMKLRLLNASHSYLAYAGTLKGYKFVHEAVSDTELKNDLEALMLKEVAPLLEIPDNFNVHGYCMSLIERFKNNKLPHQLRQIAMDGSQKIPQRILPSLILATQSDSSRTVLIKALSAWLNFVWSELDQQIDDPLSSQFTALKRESKSIWLEGMLQLDLFKALHDYPELKIEISKAVH